MAEPYAHPGEHVVDHLIRIQLALDGDTEAIAAHDAEMSAREAITENLPLAVLAARFDLAIVDLHLLMTAALPALDVRLAQRWQQALASPAPERRVFEIVDLVETGNAGALLARLAHGPLVTGGLIRLVSGPEWAREAPILQRIATVPEPIVDAITGRFGFDRTLARCARYQPHVTGVAMPEVARLAQLLAEGAAPLVVVGPAQVGKATAIGMAATRLGRGTIAASLDQLDPAQLDDLRCAARLLEAVLVLRAGDRFDALPPPVQRAAIEATRDGAILTAHEGMIARRLDRPDVVDIAPPSAVTQHAVWRAGLGELAGEVRVDELVARCPLPIGDILEAVAAVHRSHAEPVAAARARLQHRLGDVASVLTTTLAWSDLVIREDIAQRIGEILAAVAHRTRVLEEWGFAAKLPYGRSVSALFSGPPGTGKTMVATLIAQELGLELFRVDLSKVVSKWLGETEKNLGKLFDEAARVNAVLLFDEADALFAPRTEVRTSNDRNANLEVNYLLQRLESHDGIVLLTTNSASGIDEAFQRRLRFRIEFPRPEVDEREALWRAMFPPGAPLSHDVDFTALAARFNMAGGHIKNAAVRAAFLAAEQRAHAIDQRTLARAATLEWTELGNLPT